MFFPVNLLLRLQTLYVFFVVTGFTVDCLRCRVNHKKVKMSLFFFFFENGEKRSQLQWLQMKCNKLSPYSFRN